MNAIDYSSFPILYGITPPKRSTEPGEVEAIAEKTAERINQVAPDGVVIYDIQDESRRNMDPRPFPFMATLEPIDYAERLAKYTSVPLILYNCVVNYSRQQLTQWLKRAESLPSVDSVVFVGGQVSDIPEQNLSLNDSYGVFRDAGVDLRLGGVTIAERHAKKGDEHQRILKKIEDGCSFFISQAVYNEQHTIKLFNDLLAEAQATNQSLAPIILTFTPCGDGKTMRFMEWLGISIEPEVEQEILSDPNPVEKSVSICLRHYRDISAQVDTQDLALGVNIESVSKRKVEIEAAANLASQFRALKQTS